MTEIDKKDLLLKRTSAITYDIIMFKIILILMLLLGFLLIFLNSIFIDHDPMPNEDLIFSFLIIIAATLFLLKDIFNGRSFFKRKYKIQVIDIKTERAASPLKCFIRNLTYFLFLIEIIFLIINPKKRLGDIIVGTRVEYIENPEKVKRNWYEYLIPIILSFVLCYSIIMPSLEYLPTPVKKIKYIKNSFNRSNSEKMNCYFENKYDTLIDKADFKIYDQIKNDQRKYVTGILYFKNEEEIDNLAENEEKYYKIINSEFPNHQYISFIKYVYLKNGIAISITQRLYD